MSNHCYRVTKQASCKILLAFLVNSCVEKQRMNAVTQKTSGVFSNIRTSFINTCAFINTAALVYGLLTADTTSHHLRLDWSFRVFIEWCVFILRVLYQCLSRHSSYPGIGGGKLHTQRKRNLPKSFQRWFGILCGIAQDMKLGLYVDIEMDNLILFCMK